MSTPEPRPIVRQADCRIHGETDHKITVDEITTLGAHYAKHGQPCAGKPDTKLTFTTRECVACKKGS